MPQIHGYQDTRPMIPVKRVHRAGRNSRRWIDGGLGEGIGSRETRLTGQNDPLGIQDLFSILLEGLGGQSTGEATGRGDAKGGCRGRRGEDLRMGEGTGEWYGRRAIPVWDRDCGRAGCRCAGWWGLRGDSIELLGRGRERKG